MDNTYTCCCLKTLIFVYFPFLFTRKFVLLIEVSLMRIIPRKISKQIFVLVCKHFFPPQLRLLGVVDRPHDIKIIMPLPYETRMAAIRDG